MTMDDILRHDPGYADARTILGDFIDLMNELADVLAADQERGEFGRGAGWLRQADALLTRMSAEMPPAVLDLHRNQAESAIARLRGSFQLIDVQSRA